MTAAQMLRNLQAVSVTDIAGDIIEQHTLELSELNRSQLMHGKNNKGELLSPRHSENPFFKKPGAAQRYAGWKHRLNPLAPFDVPDLRITGLYHDSISFSRRGDSVVTDSNAPFAGNIASTFQNTALGLNEESKREAWSDIIRPPMVRILADKIGCGISGG